MKDVSGEYFQPQNPIEERMVEGGSDTLVEVESSATHNPSLQMSNSVDDESEIVDLRWSVLESKAVCAQFCTKTQRRNRWSSFSMLLKHEPLPLSFSSLATFPSHPDNVLFLAPTPFGALLHLHSHLCDGIRKESVEIADQITVESWIPHCALAHHVPK
ncbi:hypothetical protein Fmac_005337 [Flemingia macrophylla]|uniref:Uncharacterized protein n=1 Tax=Flemingia macrophylla TaxID=520843 RepID=A0ABD1N7G3_9FABA